MNKVLIGALVSKYHWYCTEEFLESLKLIDYDNLDIFLIENSDTDKFYNWLTEKIKDFDKGINNYGRKIKVFRYGNKIKTTQEKLAVCRNYLRDLFLEGDYDYFFSLDQDIITPSNIIKKLILNNKDVISGIYYNNKLFEGKDVLFPVVFRKYNKEIQDYMLSNKEKVKQLNPGLFTILEKYNWDFQWVHKVLYPEEVSGEGLIEVDYFGNGCVMIKREVLEKVKFRFENEFFDDVLFCKDAAEMGYKIYADCSVKCKHRIDRVWKWEKKDGVMEIIKILRD